MIKVRKLIFVLLIIGMVVSMGETAALAKEDEAKVNNETVDAAKKNEADTNNETVDAENENETVSNESEIPEAVFFEKEDILYAGYVNKYGFHYAIAYGNTFSKKTVEIYIPSFVNNNHITYYVTEIADLAFAGLTNVKKLIFAKPHYLTKIGAGAFAYTSITEFDSPECLDSIANSAFFSCKELKKVYLGKELTELGNGVFSGCNSIEEITINEANKLFIVENNLIYSKDYKKLISAQGITEKIKLADNTIAIDSYAFEGNSKVTKITINDKLEKINSFAFLNCENLTEISIPASVKKIAGNPFIACNNLTKVKISADNEHFVVKSNRILSADKKLLITDYNHDSEITFPKYIETIGPWAVAGNTYVKSVKIPNTVKKVSKGAFADCINLKHVIIGSVKTDFSADDVEINEETGAQISCKIFDNTFNYLEINIPYSKSATVIEKDLKRHSPKGMIITSR